MVIGVMGIKMDMVTINTIIGTFEIDSIDCKYIGEWKKGMKHGRGI